MKIIHRIFQYIDINKINKSELERKCDVSNGYFAKMKSRDADIGEGIIFRVLENCPDISPEWLVFGKGSMLKTEMSNSVPLPAIGSNQQPLAAIDSQQPPLAAIGSNQPPSAAIGSQQPPLAAPHECIYKELLEKKETKIEEKDAEIKALNREIGALTHENKILREHLVAKHEKGLGQAASKLPECHSNENRKRLLVPVTKS